MNVPRMLADRGNLLDWGNEKKWQFMMYDQGMLETFYRQKVRAEELRRAKAPFRDVSEGNWHAWESFDDLKYNARGFMRVPPEHRISGTGTALSPMMWLLAVRAERTGTSRNAVGDPKDEEGEVL